MSTDDETLEDTGITAIRRLERIVLKNFKCFKQADIELSKITLLTGENSSGKTSLLHSILLPFQSEMFPVDLTTNGIYANTGDFKNISFNHNVNNTIELTMYSLFGYEFIRSVWSFDKKTNMPIVEYFCMNNGCSNEFILKKQDNIYSVIVERPFSGEEYEFENIEQLRAVLSQHGNGSLGNIPMMLKYSDFFLQTLKSNINFISSFRLNPERTYYQGSRISHKVGIYGDGYLDQILNWQNTNAPEFKQLKKYLRELGLVNNIKAELLQSGRFDFKVKVKSKGVWSSLTDVGFGISQFLPILVADLQLPSNSIKPSQHALSRFDNVFSPDSSGFHSAMLLLAQPEMHLHPSIQASLADYFTKQVLQYRKQYVIETHSEYLLNRIRLNIAKGKLKPSDVSIYYFEYDIENGSVPHKIEFTKDGQILGAPDGFFETYMLDVMDIALHA